MQAKPESILNWTLIGLEHLKAMGKLKKNFLPAPSSDSSPSPGAVTLGSAPLQPTVCLSYVPSFTWEICSLHKSLSFKDSPLLGKTEFSLRFLSNSLAPCNWHTGVRGGLFHFVSKKNLFYCLTWSKQKSWTGFIHIFIMQQTCSGSSIIKALKLVQQFTQFI